MSDRLELPRREFLAASALGILSMTRLGRGGEPPADTELLYIGTYTVAGRTEGIYTVSFDAGTGELRQVGAFDAGANPSFLAIHPNGRVLYAVNEVTEREGKPTGGVSAFAIDEAGSLAKINEQASGGGAPCYVSVDRSGRTVLIANYAGGSVSVLPIQPGGGLAAATQVAQHHGTGPNAERQEAAHAHCIVTDRSNRYALAADLGIDRVLVYRLNAGAGTLRHIDGGDGVLRPGTGPRHIAFHPKLPLVFVSGELHSTVTTLRFDAARGALSRIQTQSTLPAGFTGANDVADIHVAPLGNVLYVSNRGHNSIAVVSIARSTGVLALEQLVPSGGDWPRNFSLDPTGRWLLVANERSGSVVVFRRDGKTGRLTPTPARIAIPNPVCLRFRAHTGVIT